MASLRALDYNGPAINGQHLVPGIFFSLDPESTNTVTVESRPGELMKFRLAVDRPGRWLTLNMSVGTADLSGCKIVGFACVCGEIVSRGKRRPKNLHCGRCEA